MELISQKRSSIAPRQQVMAHVCQVLMQVDEETAKRWRQFQEQSLSSAPNASLPTQPSQSSGTATECLKNFQNHQTYLLKLDKLWTLLRVWTDRIGQELQYEEEDHFAATTFPKHGGNGRLPQAAQHRLALLAKDLQTSLVPRDSPQTCGYFMLHTVSTFPFNTKVNPPHF